MAGWRRRTSWPSSPAVRSPSAHRRTSSRRAGCESAMRAPSTRAACISVRLYHAWRICNCSNVSSVSARAQRPGSRSRLPGSQPRRDPAVRPAAALAQAPRRRRAGQPDPHRGVLRGDHGRARARGLPSRAPGLGDRLQHDPAAPGPRLPHTSRIPSLCRGACETDVRTSAAD